MKPFSAVLQEERFSFDSLQLFIKYVMQHEMQRDISTTFFCPQTATALQYIPCVILSRKIKHNLDKHNVAA